jgi:hypothetical protein
MDKRGNTPDASCADADFHFIICYIKKSIKDMSPELFPQAEQGDYRKGSRFQTQTNQL